MEKRTFLQVQIQKLEQDLSSKETIVKDLKQRLKTSEIQAVEVKTQLQEEIHVLKAKNTKLTNVESTLQIYSQKLKEIPQLNAKIKSLMV